MLAEQNKSNRSSPSQHPLIPKQIDDQSEDISPIHQLAALNSILKEANISEILDDANKKIALKIWNRVKEQGV